MPSPDPLLDPPRWAPAWLSVDDVRTVRWLRRALVLVFVVGLAACVTESADSPADPQVAADGPTPGALAEQVGTILVDLVTASGDVLELCLLDADLPEERSQGLKGVTDLAGYDGMLFRWDEDASTNFVMIDTVTPLTISWWDATGTQVGTTDMTPCTAGNTADCVRYSPGTSFRYAVEVFQGELPEAGSDARLEPRPGSSCQRS